MMQWPLLFAAFTTGALVPLQLAFNGQLGGVTRNAFTASLIVFLIGAAVLAAVVLVTRAPLPRPTTLAAAAPPTVWLGGLIATVYIVAIVVLTPRLGVGLTTALILVGQIVTALALDHFGAFGNPQHALTSGRLSGLALMLGGIALIKVF